MDIAWIPTLFEFLNSAMSIADACILKQFCQTEYSFYAYNLVFWLLRINYLRLSPGAS